MQDDLIGLVAIGLDPKEQPQDDYSCQFLEKICEHIAVCIHKCLLYEMREKEKEDLDKTLYNNEITCRRFLPGEGVAGRVFESGEPVFINETGQSTPYHDQWGGATFPEDGRTVDELLLRFMKIKGR